jgi:crotonobetainyl-CoA:carnitine CoA-transferase CaiB-like acyl-CoA transferase
MSRLLNGVRVLEFGQLLNPDTVGMILADLGAEVIKVESPFLGDYLRDVGTIIAPGVTIGHVQANRGKKSVAIDLRSDEGREVFFELLATTDVFVDGTVAGKADALGIGYEAQRQVKPDIVYCQYSGFGATGPYRNIPTHGMMMSALAGALPTVEGPDGFLHPDRTTISRTESGGEPTTTGAMFTALGAVSALVQRDRTGQGAYLDVAASDAVVSHAWVKVSFSTNEQLISDRSGYDPKPKGELSGSRYQFYSTSDGHAVLFCAIEYKFWKQFCAAINREDLLKADYASFRNSSERYGWDPRLRRELTDIFGQRSLAEWIDLAATCDLPIGPAYRTMNEVRADPHMRHRGVIAEQAHPTAGEFTYILSPINVTGQPNQVGTPAPGLGDDTTTILTGLGIAPDRIQQLRINNIIC